MKAIKRQRWSKELEDHQRTDEHSENTEDDLKILLRILSISNLQPFLPLYIFEIRRYMSGQHLTQSEYALQRVVELFGDLLTQLEESHQLHTYRVVFHFCQLENIDYLVLWYLNTRTLPFEEWSEEWLFDREVQCTFILAMGTGGDLFSVALGQVSQEVESWDKTRKERAIR